MLGYCDATFIEQCRMLCVLFACQQTRTWGLPRGQPNPQAARCHVGVIPCARIQQLPNCPRIQFPKDPFPKDPRIQRLKDPRIQGSKDPRAQGSKDPRIRRRMRPKGSKRIHGTLPLGISSSSFRTQPPMRYLNAEFTFQEGRLFLCLTKHRLVFLTKATWLLFSSQETSSHRQPK